MDDHRINLGYLDVLCVNQETQNWEYGVYIWPSRIIERSHRLKIRAKLKNENKPARKVGHQPKTDTNATMLAIRHENVCEKPPVPK